MSEWNNLAWLLRTNRRQVWRVILLSLSQVACSLLAVSVAVLTSRIVDSAIHGIQDGFWQYAVLLAAVGVAQILLYFLNRHLSVDITTGVELHMQSVVFAAILRKDYTAIGKYHSGVLLDRINNDIRTIAEGASSILPQMLGMAVRLIASFVVVCRIDLQFALTFLALGTVAMLASTLVRRKMKMLHKQERKCAERASGFMQESLGNLLMIKTFGAEKIVDSRMEDYHANRKGAIRARKRYGAFLNLLMNTAFYGGYIFGLIWCIFKVANQYISIGMFSAVLQLMGQIEKPLTGIAGFVPLIAGVFASTDRVRELVALPEEDLSETISKSECSGMESIHVEQISFAYDQERVLDQADFTLHRGEFAVLCGISGIGKSTLMKLLLGVYVPTEGAITMRTNGIELPVDHRTRSVFAYVPQGNFLLSGTIRDNICMMRPDAPVEDIRRALEISDAMGFVSELPGGLETVIGERGVGLSEGQIQRIALARALLLDAPVLLLDESTSALDEGTERRVLTNLKNMTDKTCLLISHKKAALEICDSAYQIIDGKISRI